MFSSESQLRRLSFSLLSLGVLGACEKNFEIRAVPVTVKETVAQLSPEVGPLDPGDNPKDEGSGNPSTLVTEPPPPPNVKPVAVRDTTVVPVDKKIDILFVVDNSDSMAIVQSVVKASLNKFMDGFSKRGLDYHVGVVSTDAGYFSVRWAPDNLRYFGYTGYQDPKPGCLLTRFDEKFLTSSSTDFIDKFQQNVELGVKGSSVEQGLLSAINTLKNTGPGGCNQGFLRDDAFLSVVVFSDENEAVVNAPPKMVGEDSERIRDFIDTLKTAKKGRLDRVRLDAFIRKWSALREPGKIHDNLRLILDANGSAQYLVDDQGKKVPDDVYFSSTYQLAVNTIKNGGQIEDLQSDFSETLANVGSNIAKQAQSRFKLSMTPVSPLTVKVNGVTLSKSTTSGWTYYSAANQIELAPSVLNQAADFTLEISYMGKP